MSAASAGSGSARRCARAAAARRCPPGPGGRRPGADHRGAAVRAHGFIIDASAARWRHRRLADRLDAPRRRPSGCGASCPTAASPRSSSPTANPRAMLTASPDPAEFAAGLRTIEPPPGPPTGRRPSTRPCNSTPSAPRSASTSSPTAWGLRARRRSALIPEGAGTPSSANGRPTGPSPPWWSSHGARCSTPPPRSGTPAGRRRRRSASTSTA